MSDKKIKTDSPKDSPKNKDVGKGDTSRPKSKGAGKGDKYRPVDKEVYDREYERIFSMKDWPRCEQCGEEFVFEEEEPFAHCACGTTEWGHGRPANWKERQRGNPSFISNRDPGDESDYEKEKTV